MRSVNTVGGPSLALPPLLLSEGGEIEGKTSADEFIEKDDGTIRTGSQSPPLLVPLTDKSVLIAAKASAFVDKIGDKSPT